MRAIKIKEIDESAKSNFVVLGPEILKDLKTFECVSRYKSVARTMRRFQVTKYGTIMPKRPFNNRANNSTREDAHSRRMNEFKKQIYDRLSKVERV